MGHLFRNTAPGDTLLGTGSHRLHVHDQQCHHRAMLPDHAVHPGIWRVHPVLLLPGCRLHLLRVFLAGNQG